MCCDQSNFQSSACGCKLATLQSCRHFFSKQERVEILETYKKQLENEILGVEQEIQELNK